MISNLAAAVAGVFGYQKQRDAEKNSSAVVLGAERQREQKAEDQVNTTIAKGDVNAIRKDLAE